MTLLYALLATLQLGLWFWGLSLWRRRGAQGRSWALAMVLVPTALLWYDNARIALGSLLGAGELLYALSVPALVWHWTMLPFFVLAAAFIARDSRLPGHRRAWTGWLFWGVAALLLALDLPYAWRLLSGEMTLALGCIGDAVRYTATLSEAYLCAPGEPIHRVGPGPLVAIVMNAVVLVVAAGLWRYRGQPLLFATSATMFVLAAAGPALGANAAPIANVGEVIFVFGLLVSADRAVLTGAAAPRA